MKPDASKHDPRPEYLRELLERAGFSQVKAARRIGIDERTLRYYISDVSHPNHRDAPYPVQYALEQLSIKQER